MSEEILINVTPREVRVAVVENGVLQEVYIERANKRGLVGNIYKGRIMRVLPGMQAAFVDVGLERTAFLHASDIVSTHLDRGMMVPTSENNGSNGQALSKYEERRIEPITSLVRKPGTCRARNTPTRLKSSNIASGSRASSGFTNMHCSILR